VLAVGYEHSCAIAASQQLYCWGRNDYGQLGDGTATNRNVARVVSGTLLFTRAAAGAGHTCAIAPEGRLYCWGRNVWGQVGDGSAVIRRTPVPIAPTLRFSEVVAGAENTCALTTDGAVYCWGFMLGTQSTSYHLPSDVSGGTYFVSLGAGDHEVCGVSLNGASYCLTPTFTPDGLSGGGGNLWRPQPSPSPTAKTFAGGLQHMCALDGAGVASCWGANTYGQLGVGTTQGASGAVMVGGNLVFRGLYAGYDWSCGTTAVGVVYCWGHNSWGVQGAVVGQRYVEPSPHPLPVPPGVTFAAMDGGFYHMCGIAADERVFCWGGGFAGQLGDGVPVAKFYNRSMPAPVVRP